MDDTIYSNGKHIRMNSGHAIVQTTADPPSVEQLRQAFTSLISLTDHDANTMAKNAFGILVENLSQADATTLQQALANQGVPTRVVARALLPELPPRKRLKRADPTISALLSYDALGRAVPVEWSHVTLIAAGSVVMTQFQRVEKKRTKAGGMGVGGYGYVAPITFTEYGTKEKRGSRLLLQICLDVEPYRYYALGEEFLYKYLGDGARPDSARNFVTLVQDLMRYAPHAMANLGASAIAEDGSQTFEYPSRHAFEEEIVWLFWLDREGISL